MSWTSRSGSSARRSTRSAPEAGGMRMAHRIWIVDDEQHIRTAMTAVLSDIGHETRGFGNAEELYTALVEEEASRLEVIAPVVRKPFDFAEFIEAVDQQLASGAA